MAPVLKVVCAKNLVRLRSGFLFRYDTQDPRATIEEGKAVTACAMDFFKTMKAKCMSEFASHYTCLNENQMMYGYCRKTQKPYDACVLQHLNLESIQSDIVGGVQSH